MTGAGALRRLVHFATLCLLCTPNPTCCQLALNKILYLRDTDLTPGQWQRMAPHLAQLAGELAKEGLHALTPEQQQRVEVFVRHPPPGVGGLPPLATFWLPPQPQQPAAPQACSQQRQQPARAAAAAAAAVPELLAVQLDKLSLSKGGSGSSSGGSGSGSVSSSEGNSEVIDLSLSDSEDEEEQQQGVSTGVDLWEGASLFPVLECYACACIRRLQLACPPSACRARVQWRRRRTAALRQQQPRRRPRGAASSRPHRSGTQQLCHH